jgi:fibronectin-binding autotransporter adhesin
MRKTFYPFSIFYLCLSSLFSATWTGDSSTNWNDNSNWDTSSFPNATGASATLPDLSGIASESITLGQDITLGSLTFSGASATEYTVSGGNSLNFSVSSGTATITTEGTGFTGTKIQATISAPLVLNSTTEVSTQQFGSMILSGNISGTGGLKVTSGTGTTGTLTLSGTNSYSGGNTFYASTISVSSDSNFGAASNSIVTYYVDFSGVTVRPLILCTSSFSTSRTLDITGPSVILSVNSGQTLTWNGTITGNDLYGEGSGLLILTGNNSFKLLSLIGSKLQVSSDENLGTGTIYFSASGATLYISGASSFSSGKSIVLSQPGTIDVDSGVTATFSGSISSTSSLTKTGDGSLILSGSNSYSGGTTVSAGIFQGTTSSLVGTITNNASLVFDQATSGSFSGNIGGTGSVSITGGGTVTLSGSNSYTGGTSVLSSTLKGTTDTLQGDISVDSGSSLDFDQSSDGTYAGVLSGDGSLILSGSGTVSLSGNNSYSGGTQILSGTLSGDTTTIQGDIVDNSSLVFNQTFAGIYNGSISGTGTVTKSGSDILVLFGSNSYTGGTIVEEGTLLQISDDSTLGSMEASLIFAGSGGKLTIDLGPIYFSERDIFLDADGTIEVSSGIIADFAGDISGVSALVKSGEGRLILSGDNDYEGGTSVLDGILEGSANPSLQGDILNNASVIFTQATHSGIYSGSMTGTGSLTKDGPEDLILTGTNLYTGGTFITNGSLQGDTLSLQGSIENDSLLLFDQSFNGSYAGSITGTGSLTKNGSGNIRLEGVSSQASVQVNEGALFVNGNLTAPCLVSSGATLGGTGEIIGDVTISAAAYVKPGASIGTLTVTGSYLQQTGSFLEIELSPLASDRLDVIGDITIEPGAFVLAVPLQGIYLSSNSYTIMTSTLGRTGTFSGLEFSYPTFTGQLEYTPSDVILNLQLLPFTSVVSGGNAGHMATYLSTLSPSVDSDLALTVSSLRFLDLDTLDTILNELTPAIFKGLNLAQQNSALHLQAALSERLQSCRKWDSLEKSCHVCSQEGEMSFWENQWWDRSLQDSIHEQIGFNTTGAGIVTGVDYYTSQNIVWGGLLGYSYSHIDWDRGRGFGHANSGYLGIYALWHRSHFYLEGDAIGFLCRYRASRHIDYNEIDRRAIHHNFAQGCDLHLGAGTPWVWNRTSFAPFGEIDYLFEHDHSFTESGASSLDLAVNASHATLWRSQLGVKLDHCYDLLTSSSLTPHLTLGWVREMRKGKHFTSHFKDSSGSFRSVGLAPDRSLFALDAGANFSLRNQWDFYLSYQGEWGGNYWNQGVMGGFTFIW